ncbi:hypothetical protein [Variovorax paradoxus]|uniref:hypothetical protein n=1 Tax=Variovorax paradoxus TaxID=34073 RepID=UPI002787E29E|nr:hypothetical protein [Variovorax paradoxus]MDQ0587333.1 hypothetical protein [Variovorax paradoxus]
MRINPLVSATVIAVLGISSAWAQTPPPVQTPGPQPASATGATNSAFGRITAGQAGGVAASVGLAAAVASGNGGNSGGGSGTGGTGGTGTGTGTTGTN